MIFENFYLHFSLVVLCIIGLAVTTNALSTSLQAKLRKKILLLGIALLSLAVGLSYLLLKPIKDTSGKIVQNKQFMITKDGVCEKVIIPKDGKKYVFSCDVLKAIE